MSDPQIPTTRRELLRNAVVTAAATTAATAMNALPAAAKNYMPTTAVGMRRVIGANDRIHLGHIGVGTQGFVAHCHLIKQYQDQNNTQSIAVCDLFQKRITEARKWFELTDSQGFLDYRKVLADKNIDAVMIATSDNWHAPIAIDAMNAGKHVYIEKPMCKSLEETFAIYDTVKRTKRTLQVGSQGCSDLKWHLAQKAVKDGKIGKVVVGQGSYMRNSKEGEWNRYGVWDKNAGPDKTGDEYIDWKTFTRGNPALKEFNPDIFFGWRKWFAIGSGLVGDLFPHRLHPLFIAMNIPTDDPMKGYPHRVSSGGGLYVQRTNPDTGKIDRDVPDFTTLTVDYADYTMMAMSSSVNEQGWQDCIRGNKATIYFGGNDIEIKPERIWSDEIDESKEAAGDGEHIEAHEKNWLDCIRSGEQPNCNIEIAARVQTLITLGELAYRNNKTYLFDPNTRKATTKSPRTPRS